MQTSFNAHELIVPWQSGATRIEALKQSYMFEVLPPEALAQLSEMVHPVALAAQQSVFVEGDPVTAFYLVLSGRVQAYKIAADGREMVLHLVEPGEVFAEYPVFGNITAYPANAIALTPSALLAIPAEAFRQWAAARPELLLRMLARFSQRIREFNTRIEELAFLSVDVRLAKYLLLHAQADGSVSIPSKKLLAAQLGTVPETLSRAIGRLKGQALIRDIPHGLRVEHFPHLRRLVETAASTR